jgi:RNA-directed DNA polymerase
MKLNQIHIDQIKEDFIKMKSKEDLLNLLNEANKILHEERAKPFSLKALTYYSSPNLAKKRYRSFPIKKKSGGIRTIHAPISGLKSIQKALNLILQCVFEPHRAATGFIPEKSIVDNAKVHLNQYYVYNIDLKDFFPGIDQARIWKRLQFSPFDLNEKNNRLELANRIAALCCTELEVERMDEQGEWAKVKRNVLPQGAPTSPTLTNIIAFRLDHKLSGLARRFNLNYSRYADDITFSSSHNVYQKDSDFLNELHRIIADQNFHINPKKTRLQKNGYRKEVTGLTVNEKVNVSRRYVKQIRMWLYYWERHGIVKAYSIFLRDYKADKGHVKKGNPDFISVLDGKLLYLKMVKGEEDGTYLGLKKRFDTIRGIQSPIEKIIEIWEKEGIEKAMSLYTELKL